MNNLERFELFRLFACILAENITLFEEESTEELTVARRQKEDQILIVRAIALTDLSLDLLSESGHTLPQQIVIPCPLYQRGDQVILTSGEKRTIEIIGNSYFDFIRGAWLYELQSDHSTYYPQSDLSTNL